MAIRLRVQKDYLRTEASVDLPASVSEVDEHLREERASAKVVILYNDGHVQGINIEHNKKMSDEVSSKTRQLMGIRDITLG